MEETVNLNFEMPRTLRREFKAKCILKGIDMKDRLIELITEDIKR